MWNYLFSMVLPAVIKFVTNEAAYTINALTGIFTKASVDLGATDAIVSTTDDAVKSEIIVLANFEGAIDALLGSITLILNAVKTNDPAALATAITAAETDLTKTVGIWNNQKTLIENYLASVLKEVLVIKNEGI